MSSLLLLPFADIYDNSLFMWKQRSHHLLLSCIRTLVAGILAADVRRGAAVSLSLLSTHLRFECSVIPRQPPSIQFLAPQPPLVLGRPFFFVVPRHAPPSLCQPFLYAYFTAIPTIRFSSAHSIAYVASSTSFASRLTS